MLYMIFALVGVCGVSSSEQMREYKRLLGPSFVLASRCVCVCVCVCVLSLIHISEPRDA